MSNPVKADELSKSEQDLLLWLGQQDFAQYGECHGRALDRLVELKLAQIHGPGEHQYFIANDRTGELGMMYRAVSLTESGISVLQAIKMAPQ